VNNFCHSSTMVVRLFCKQVVAGSNPACGSISGTWFSGYNARFASEEQGFDSPSLHFSL
jgi:hypothetical protein